jgi:hypothetical protein
MRTLDWYREQPHHTPECPERDQRVTVFTVEFAGVLEAQGFVAETVVG